MKYDISEQVVPLENLEQEAYVQALNLSRLPFAFKQIPIMPDSMVCQPGSYKDIDQVIFNQLDLIKPCVILQPLGNMKG